MPDKIYVLGNEKLLNKKSIAIVGSRDCSKYGFDTSYKLAKDLSSNKITIVSGMAIGIDTAAHSGSIEEKGKTIAVLGGGFNHIYPKENEELFFNILKNGGCIISEYSEETEVNMSNFPKRNRLISGLAMGVIVVEAKYRSGSTITAKHTVAQKKQIFCIPGLANTVHGYGTNNLIKKGAKLITSADDVLDYYGIKKIVSNDNTQKLNQRKIPPKYKDVYKLITNVPININDLIRKTSKSVVEINEAITMLEIDGYIQSTEPNCYIRSESL